MGMEYCCGSEELYKEVLEAYLKNGRSGEMQQSFEEEDWGNYRIQAHALKSASLSIGARELSEQARLLEMATLLI